MGYARKPIVQEHPMGCGIACVAYVTGKSYSDALKLVESKKAIDRGYRCGELAKALRKLGLKYVYRKITSKNRKYIKTEGSIVLIAPSRKYPAGHYLVKTSKGWMNPWINFPSMTPAKAGFSRELPGRAWWILIPSGTTRSR